MSLDERFFLTCEDAAFEWLKRPALQTLFALLNRDGEEVRVVGGAVRNALLGEAVSDIDCATTAEPSLVMNRAQEAGIRVLPTGLDHGTVTLLIETVAYEVTTLRADIETDGRRARVAFGRDWQLDAMRRDFTMNALYLDRQGRLYDPTGLGLADAKTRYIRFIGDADKRIAEDYLRVLRFFRFHAQYGGQCDGPDYHACIAAQGHLSQLSRERVGTEIVKLLKGRYAVTALEAMHQGGLLPALLGGVAHVSRFARLVSLSSQLHLDPDVTLLLTALLVEHREDAVRIAGRLRLANRQRDAMARLGEGVRTVTSISEMDLQKLAYRYGKDAAGQSGFAGADEATDRSGSDGPFDDVAQSRLMATSSLPCDGAGPFGLRHGPRSGDRGLSCQARAGMGCERLYSSKGATAQSQEAATPGLLDCYGHFTSGGMEERIELTLPPVLRPKMVPRS